MTTGYSSMTKAKAAEEIQIMDRFVKKLLTSKSKTRIFLVENGFVTKDGKLAKRYRSS